MARMILTVGNTPVTLDTDKPTESQADFNKALSGAIESAKAEAAKAKETELSVVVGKGQALSTYLVDECIRLMKVSPDKVLNARVANDEVTAATKAVLDGQPVGWLIEEHKRLTGEVVTVAKPQTTEENPGTPAALEGDKDPAKELAAKFAPANRVTFV